MTSKALIRDLLKKSGIELGGTRPWDITVHEERVYDRVFARGTLATGESYMDGWWSSNALDESMCHMHQVNIGREFQKTSLATKFRFMLNVLRAKIFNLQNMKRAFQVAEKHYNIGNDLYTKMLDPWMQYSCGYWERNARTLQEAQEAKLDLIARKLQLKPGMRVLDVGCGWGGLAKYFTEKHGVSVVGITVSDEQAKHARDWLNGHSVEVRVVDYRALQAEPFDRIVSVGMFEHVGYKNYRTYMEHMARLLTDDGIFLLHTIGGNVATCTIDPWINTYIFPNGIIPAPAQIASSIEKLFVLEDWHNFGASYDATLMAWYENFKHSWPELKSTGKYDNRFYRMWEYYLLSCAGAFRARSLNLWQIVLTKRGLAGGYTSIR